MPVFKLESFSGIVPKSGPTQLQDNQAQIARNLRLQSNEIRPWKGQTLAYTPVTANLKTIYKFDGPTGTNPVWLEWDSDVDVVRGPVADTEELRLYFTSDSFGPRKTNWLMATGNMAGVAPYPNAWYEMGVPAPTGAPNLSAAGTGSDPVEVRSYIYTHVTEFGSVAEESAPSPASLISANFSGDSVTISGFSTPPTGNYNFKYRRIYRGVTGGSSITYQLVAEIPIAQSSYTDTKSVTALGQVLPSLYYTPPPSGLRGLVDMPNGILAGFVGNQIWFCEPYLPHAWPEIYTLTTDYPIVGLGVFGNSLFVGTTEQPYLVTGSSPLSMAQEKLPIPQPCVSKRSIASDQYGVLYASPNGLVAVGPGTNDVATNALYTRDEWQALNPSSMIGALYNNMYFGFYEVSGLRDSIVIQRNDNPPLANFSATAKAVFSESSTGSLYIVSSVDNKVYKQDADAANTTLYQWKSKRFVLPRPVSFAVMQIHADYDSMTAGKYINVKIYANGVQIHSQDVTSAEPFRLPSAGMHYDWEIEFSGNVALRRAVVATSIAELKAA